MSGETEADISAWTVDSLRQHLEEIITEKDNLRAETSRRYEQRFEAQERAFQASLDAQQKGIDLTVAALTDHYDTVLTERDRRYQERYEASERAVVIALAKVDKEFHEHLRQVREETSTAMHSSDKAIAKAEVANEKRFESVNEFRAQQSDLITTFARKSEVDSQIAGIIEKINVNQAATLQLAGSTLPRNEYDRAHVDLADKVTNGDKAMNEKLDAQVKAIEARIALLQSQLSSIEAITR